MPVTAASALNVAGSDTDARDYTTASWTPTAGKVYLVAFAVHDLGGQPLVPTISGNNITWSRVGNDVGGGVTQPAMAVWAGYADSSATAGAITFSGAVPSGQTADGAIWGIAELSDVGRGTDLGFVQSGVASTTNDTVTVTLGAFASANNATGAWFISYDNAGGALTNTAGSGFNIVTGLNAQQATGGDTMRLSFQFRGDNDTSVDVTASAANDRLLMHAVEIRAAVTHTPTAAIAGDGSLSATAFRTQFRSAAIAGNGDWSASLVRTAFRSASIAGNGDWAASATRIVFCDTNVAGSGDWFASATVTKFASAAVAGNGDWSASATRIASRTASIAGNGDWSATAFATRFVSAAIAGDGAWSATVIRVAFRDAAIAGNGDWSAAVTVTRFIDVTISGNGTLAATAFATRFVSGNITGFGFWSATDFATRFVIASIAGNGAWSASTTVTRFVSLSVLANGLWSATLTRTGVAPAEEDRFGGVPYSRRELDRQVYEDQLARIIADDDEVLLCLLT